MVFSALPSLEKSGPRVIGYAAQTLSLGQISVGVATSIRCKYCVVWSWGTGSRSGV